MMHSPGILILDEATSGLDPLMQDVFYELLKEEKMKGTTIFFSSHNLNEIKKICDKVGIIKNGNLIEVKPIKEFLNQEFCLVKVKTKDYKLIKKEIDDKIISENNDEIVFMYDKAVDSLLNLLQKIKVEKLYIEEPSVEEIFKHYYESGDKND